MINYSSIINILKSNEYVDKTDCFEEFLDYRFCTLENCEKTGSSLFLKTFACFLDKSIETRAVFQNMKIGRSENFSKEVNTYRVVWLDFSDFDADCYDKAVEYIKEKMSVVYKRYYQDFEFWNNRIVAYQSFEYALDIIEKKSSEKYLQDSLRRLLLQLRGYENRGCGRKLAVVIDNLVLLESVAVANGYSDKMVSFLKAFVVEDVYKYCDVFLQIGDLQEKKDSWFSFQHYVAYRYFNVFPEDLNQRYPELVVAEELQHAFNYEPVSSDVFDWESYVLEGREIVRKARREEEQRRLEYIRVEKIRYAENILPEIPLFSPNMGIREKHLDKNTTKYAEMNSLLKTIYDQFYPQFNTDRVYNYFQKLDIQKSIVNSVRGMESILGNLSEDNPKWRKAAVNTSGGYWIQVLYVPQIEKDGSAPVNPEDLKVYACFNTLDIQNIFVDSLEFLLRNASHAFGAKIATCSRSDQMCYWISQSDFKYLESFFKPYFKDMNKSLPFVAYYGMLGISKDFPGVDESHNATQAHIISDYLKGINAIEEVDLEDMYNNYIAKWNADIYEENAWGGFKNNSALSFVVIMDTLDTILSNTDMAEESFLMSGDSKIWRILSGSSCWADVNKKWKTIG